MIKKILILSLSLLLLSLSQLSYAALACETITVGNSAIGFTASKYKSSNGQIAQYAICSLETTEIRYWTNGTPTSTVGIPIYVGSYIWVTGTNDITQFSAISTSGSTTGILSCCYSLGNN